MSAAKKVALQSKGETAKRGEARAGTDIAKQKARAARVRGSFWKKNEPQACWNINLVGIDKSIKNAAAAAVVSKPSAGMVSVAGESLHTITAVGSASDADDAV
jgi:hypothetical protein